MKIISYRSISGFGFIVCCLLLAIAYYMQYVQAIQPCPLCMLQRIVFMGLAIVMLIAVLHNPNKTGRRVYGVVNFILALIGMLLAWRHIWLQHHPTASTDICVPGLGYVMRHLPLNQAVHFLLESSENCSKVTQIWGVAIPVWTLICFFLVGLLAGVQIIFAEKFRK